MHTITCYLDFISPYAYLAFETLPQHLQGLSVQVRYRPILFAGLLKHHGQLGPAEIPGKREWTYRQVLWQARQSGVQLDMPLQHPFNPLQLLRLALACSSGGDASRWVCEQIFRHVWIGGQDAADPARFEALSTALKPSRAAQDPDVKRQLVTNTDLAIERGVFGVPTFEAQGRLFWGLDSLPMLRQSLEGDEWFETVWPKVASVVQGVRR